MDCPHCHAALPGASDPTARFVNCSECGAEVDLAEAMEGTGEVTIAGAETLVPEEREDGQIGRLLADGRYRIDSFLGVGGMGTVYLGTQVSLGRPVAIKVLAAELSEDEQFRQRFQREAGALAALDHPHIVAVHDLGIEDGTHYIVMSYVAGPDGKPLSLKELVATGPVEEELALRILAQVSGALQYAHGHGIVHRDIKPGNILLDADGNAKLADFGIARVSENTSELTLTMPGTTIGTLKYMSPEQKADAKSVDARSDIYSLGVVFYEMLTGEAPEGRFSLPSELRKELDPRLDRIVDRALQRAVDNRYQSAEEVAKDISRITTEREYGKLHEEDAPKPPAPRTVETAADAPPPPPPREQPAPAATDAPADSGPKRKRRPVLILVVLALVAAGIVGAFMEEEGEYGGSGGFGDGRAKTPTGANAARIRQLLASRQGVEIGTFEEMKEELDGYVGPGGVGPARAAVDASLRAQTQGNYSYMVAQIPESLVPSLGQAFGVPPQQVRMGIMQLLSAAPGLASYEVGEAVFVERDIVLVRYRFQLYGMAMQETVAVAVREGGSWGVLL